MQKYFIFFVLILTCTPSSWADSIPCIFKDLDGNTFDFTALQTVTVSAVVNSGGYNFYVTPCATTPQNTKLVKPCPKTTSPIIQIDPTNDDCVYLADINTQAFAKTAGGDITLSYEGQQCGPTLLRKAVIRFECDPNTESNFYQAKETGTCEYEFDWKTKYACVGFAPNPNNPNNNNGLSGGAWFLILLLAIALPVYIIGGIIYNIKVKSATGIEVLPNYAFWKDLPSLLKDGFAFTFGKMCGRGGYQKV